MCGRYRLTAKERYLRDHFGLDKEPAWTPRWNIAPTQLVPVIRQKSISSKRSFDLVRWGLIPSWAKDPSIATKTINAMSETAADKPAFRDALRLRRCLIPADSFYEWQSISSKHKQPFSIGMADDSVFAFAGLWESWVGAKGDIVETCTILTTTPNALVAEVHRRMPAILKRDEYERWLNPSIKNPSAVTGCLEPFDAALMRSIRSARASIARKTTATNAHKKLKLQSQPLQRCSDLRVFGSKPSHSNQSCFSTIPFTEILFSSR